MCSRPKVEKAETPAAAPAPALAPAEAPQVGETRRAQNEELFGQESPNYRVKRSKSVPSINPSASITM